MLPFACVPWHCGVVRPAMLDLAVVGRMSGIAIVCVCWLYAFAWNGEHHNPSHFSSCAFGVCLCVPVCLAYKMMLYATSLAVCMYSLISWRRVINGCYLVDPASSHMLVSKIKPCMFKKLVVGPWVGLIGPPLVCTGWPRPFCRRCAPGLNWPGRASGAVTLKKLECSKQAYALDTLAWDNTTGF
ncbi:hypothetical protein KIW84_UN0767 [Lathyrus oleraceus]|nr:hypothetical protein KIW84_UN0767 [Pisum sativum]